MKNLLDKYFSKRNVRLLSMAMGIATVIFYIIQRYTLAQIAGFNLGAIGMFSFVFLIFYIVFLVSVAVILYYTYLLYFDRKDQDMSMLITFGVNCWAAFALLFNIQTVIFFFKLMTMNSLFDLLGLGNVDFAINLLDITFLAFVGLAIYNGILFYQQKDEEETITREETNTEPNPMVEKIKSFLSTKNGKLITGGVVVVIVVAAVGFNLLSNQEVIIDLTKNVKVEFSGTSGDGYAFEENSSFDYDGGDEDVERFLDTIYFTIDESNGKLENGDTITVIANYSEELAEQANVNPEGIEKTFEVKGLEVEYSSYEELSKKQQAEVEDAWDAYFIDDGELDSYIRDDYRYTFKSGSEFTISDKNLVAMYYANSEYSGSDEILFLVEFTVTGTERYGEGELKQTNYYLFSLKDISVEGLKDIEDSDFEYKSVPFGSESDEAAIAEVNDYYENGYLN